MAIAYSFAADSLVDEIHPACFVRDQHVSLGVRGHEARRAARVERCTNRQSFPIDDDDAPGVKQTDDYVDRKSVV